MKKFDLAFKVKVAIEALKEFPVILRYIHFSKLL